MLACSRPRARRAPRCPSAGRCGRETAPARRVAQPRGASCSTNCGIARAIRIRVPFDQHAAGNATDVVPFGAGAHVDQPRSRRPRGCASASAGVTAPKYGRRRARAPRSRAAAAMSADRHRRVADRGRRWRVSACSSLCPGGKPSADPDSPSSIGAAERRRLVAKPIARCTITRRAGSRRAISGAAAPREGIQQRAQAALRPVPAQLAYGIVSAFRCALRNTRFRTQRHGLNPSPRIPQENRMAAAPADVLKMIKDKEVKFVDLRFTDTRGKEQHVQVPAKQFTQDKFDSGHAFDGSSIAGWKGIEASDMLLMPDPDSARIDPFTDETTLNITCDVVEPAGRQGLRPRSALARQARRGVSQVDRPRRHRLLRPGARVLHFRLGDLERRHVGLRRSRSSRKKRRGRPARNSKAATWAIAPPVKGGYFPVPPVDSLQDIRNAMCARARRAGRRSRSASTTKSRPPGQCEIGTKFNSLVKRADWMQILKYTVHDGRAFLRQDRDVHAEADRRRQRLGHARAPVGLEGRPEPVRGQRLRGPVRVRAVLHRRHDQARQGAERDHQPGHQFVQAAGARASKRRSISPTRRATARRRAAFRTSAIPKGAPRRSALSRSDGESVPLLSPRC